MTHRVLHHAAPGALAGALFALTAAWSAPAAAQTTAIPAGPGWTLADPATPGPRPKGGTRKARAAAPAAPGSTSEQDAARAILRERAAHNADLQAQTRAREDAKAAAKSREVPQFGGYDASRDMGDGSLRPGATFKF